MLADGCRGSWPPLEEEQALEVTRIHSVAGLVDPDHSADRLTRRFARLIQRVDSGDRRRRAEI